MHQYRQTAEETEWKTKIKVYLWHSKCPSQIPDYLSALKFMKIQVTKMPFGYQTWIIKSSRSLLLLILLTIQQGAQGCMFISQVRKTQLGLQIGRDIGSNKDFLLPILMSFCCTQAAFYFIYFYFLFLFFLFAFWNVNQILFSFSLSPPWPGLSKQSLWNP